MQNDVDKTGTNNSVTSLINSNINTHQRRNSDALPPKTPLALIDSTKRQRRDSDAFPKIPLALIDNKPLTLASFANFIRGNSTDYLIIPFNHHDEFIDYMGGNQNAVKIIVYSIGSGSANSQCVNDIIPTIKTYFPQIPLVLIADCEDPDCYIKAINIGASAYITTSSLPAVMIAALKLVLEGGIFAPVKELFSGINSNQQMPKNNSSEEPENNHSPDILYFTPRQLEVLEHVKLGEQNKVIAYKLGMQECTVKVHIRDIMKKLNATNRTQLVYNASRIQATSDPT